VLALRVGPFDELVGEGSVGFGRLSHDDHRHVGHLRDGRREDYPAEFRSRNQIGAEVADNRREEPCDATQDGRVGKELELVDVIVAPDAAGHKVIAARQGALGDDAAQPFELGDHPESRLRF